MASNKLSTITSKVEMDDGASVNVKVLGGNDPSKPLLIAVHGAPGLSTLEETEGAHSFLSEVFQVLVFDLRGGGGSDHVPPYTHDRWIKDIETLRKWVGADSFVLSGYSYGGFIALDYAIRHGDKLLALILRDTWTRGLTGMMTALASVLRSEKVKVDVARQIRLWSGNLRDDQDAVDSIREIIPIYAPPDDPSNKKSNEQTEFEGPEGGLVYHSATQNAAFSRNLPLWDVREQIKEIKVPALVLVGRHDVIAPVEISQEIASSIPGARLEIFEHSGHNPAADEPAKFQKIVQNFLEEKVL